MPRANTESKRELFGYVRGGYDKTLRAFERELIARGVTIRTSCPVERVVPAEGGITIVTATDAVQVDRAVVTLVPPLAARLCPTLTPGERTLCNGVEYQGIICASVLTEKSLTPYYITNIADATMPYTAVIEMTALVDRDELAGNALVYLPKYVASNDPAFALDDRTIEESFMSALQRMHPGFSRDSVRAFRISRVPYVFPIPTLGYSERLPPIATATPGLFMASSANIVNGTLNVNETVKLANSLIPELLAERPIAAAREAVVA